MEGKGGADGEENDDEEGYFDATVAEPQEGGASKSSMDLSPLDKFQKNIKHFLNNNDPSRRKTPARRSSGGEGRGGRRRK